MDNILSKLTDEEREFVSSLITRDPFADLYHRGVVAYMLVLIVLLLWPFDLVFQKQKNNVRWIGTSNGIEFSQEGQVLSLSPTESLCGRLLTGSGLSLEVWASAHNNTQSGPARIVSYSLNPRLRNFTLGQSEKNLVMRLRTTETDLNGMRPHVEVDNVFTSANVQHIVVTYDFSQQSVYINGEKRVSAKIPGGKFTNWDPSCYLVLGNEATGDRSWRGKIFYVAIYSRPLAETEIRQNYRAGWFSESSSSLGTRLISDGLVARYSFKEREGDKVGDSSGFRTPLDLHIPMAIQTQKKPYLHVSYTSFLQDANLFRDVVLNIVAFIPVGFLFHAMLRTRRGSSLKTSAFVFIIGTAFTLSVESLQHFSLTRHSSLLDVFSNVLGTALGIAIDRFYRRHLKSRGKLLRIKGLRD